LIGTSFENYPQEIVGELSVPGKFSHGKYIHLVTEQVDEHIVSKWNGKLGKQLDG